MPGHRTQTRIHAPQARAARERDRAYERDRKRRNGRALYHTAAWKNLRRMFLSEHPVCACGAPANIVDHVIPHRGSNALFFDGDNLQPLCKRCHDRKTVRHDGGFGNATAHAPREDEGFGI